MKFRNRASVLATALLLLSASSCKFYDQLQARNELNRGVTAYSAKQYVLAVDHFQRAIELDSELIDAYVYLAAAYRAQYVPMVQNPENVEKGRQAIATFEKVLEIDPKHSTAVINIADLYRNMGQPEQAKNWYRKLMEFQDDDSEALYGIAVIDYNLSDSKTGVDGENVTNLSPEDVAQVNLLVDEGIDSVKKALEIRPEYTDAMEYLNLLYREKAELASDPEQKRQWNREADKLALQALDLKRKQKEEEERKRRELFRKEEAPQ